MWKEFKEFVSKGNVFGLAVGIIIGAAFGKIVSSFVADLLMPPIGLLIGGVDFTDLFITISGASFPTLAEAQKAGAVTLNYGVFIKALVDFLIIAFALFLMIKALNRLNREQPPAPEAPTTKVCPHCISTIPLTATRCPACTSQLAPATELA